jgi:hypothetical protein
LEQRERNKSNVYSEWRFIRKMKSLAYWDRVLIKDIVNNAFEDYIARHEKKRTVK